MLRAQDVLQAYTMISISMMVVLTSLRRQEEHISKQAGVSALVRRRCLFLLLGHRLDDEDVFSSHRLLDLHPRFYGNNAERESGAQKKARPHTLRTKAVSLAPPPASSRCETEERSSPRGETERSAEDCWWNMNLREASVTGAVVTVGGASGGDRHAPAEVPALLWQQSKLTAPMLSQKTNSGCVTEQLLGSVRGDPTEVSPVQPSGWV